MTPLPSLFFIRPGSTIIMHHASLELQLKAICTVVSSAVIERFQTMGLVVEDDLDLVTLQLHKWPLEVSNLVNAYINVSYF